MSEKTVFQSIIRNYLNRYLFSAVLALLLVYALHNAGAAWLRQTFGYRDIITIQQIQRGDVTAPRYYTSVEGRSLEDSHWSLSRGTANSRIGYFSFLRDENWRLVVFSERIAANLPLNLEGHLFLIDEDLYRELRAYYPNQADTILSAMFHYSAVRIENDYSLFFAPVAGTLILVLIVLLIYWLIRIVFWKQHRYWRDLRRFGNSPESIMAELSSDMAIGFSQTGQITLGTDWMAIAGKGFYATRYDSLIWVYEFPRAFRLVERSSDRHTMFISDRYGKQFSLHGTAKDIFEMQTTIAGRAPWIFTANTPEVHQMWRNNREEMIAAVQQRRTVHENRKDLHSSNS